MWHFLGWFFSCSVKLHLYPGGLSKDGLKRGSWSKLFCDGGRLWCQWWKEQKQKKLEDITIIIIIIIYVVMVLMMGLHWRSKWVAHTVAGCWLSLPMPCHHDCIPPVISKIYFITTVYHQPSQKDISSWLYTSHHLDIPVVVISSQLYTSCRYYIPTIYQL